MKIQTIFCGSDLVKLMEYSASAVYEVLSNLYVDPLPTIKISLF